MKKQLVLFIIWIYFLLWGFSQWNFKITGWDCNNWFFLFLKKFSNNYNFSNNKIITKAVFNRSKENLQKYCNLESWVPTSTYFLEQLLNTAFRKIDAIKWLTYSIEPDPLWEERRQYLNNIYQQNKIPSNQIISKFIKYWGTADDNVEANNHTLYWKYLLACQEIEKIYPNISIINNKSIINTNFNKFCKQIAKNRYLKELDLIQKTSFINFYTNLNNELFDNFTKHTEWKSSFSDKLLKLYDKFTVSLWDFQYLVLRFVKVLDANTK